MRTYARERLLMLGIVLLVAVGASPAVGQLAAPRTLAELKAEVQLRADRRAYPLATLDAREVREALAQLTSLDRDEWAGVWSGACCTPAKPISPTHAIAWIPARLCYAQCPTE